ncbi:MAG: RNase H1/viroplasmin domain-containing protein [Thomasclavelia sp.]
MYLSWDECKMQVDRYSGAVYKSFSVVKMKLKCLSKKSRSLLNKD